MSLTLNDYVVSSLHWFLLNYYDYLKKGPLQNQNKKLILILGGSQAQDLVSKFLTTTPWTMSA